MIPDASRCSQIGWMQSDVLPGTLGQFLQYSATILPVLLNAPQVLELNTRSFWRVCSCHQNASNMYYCDVQISERMGILATFPRPFLCTSMLEPNSPGLIIIMFISNSTIWSTIFHLHTLIQAYMFNIQSSRYPHRDNYLQAVWYRCYVMQNSLSLIVWVPQLLWQVQYVCYQSLWPAGKTSRYNQRGHADLCSLWESLPHNLEVQNVICIAVSFRTS